MGAACFKKKKEKLDGIPKMLWEIAVKDIDGNTLKLEEFKKYKALLITNVASGCSLTNKQYRGLVKLHEKYRDRGLEILGFPCNQFNGQESGCDLDIKKFATEKFNVQFRLFSKIEVNGPDCHPLY